MLLTMESKTAAQHKLEAMIEKGRSTAGSVIEHVMRNQPKDRLVRSRDIAFIASPESTEITMSFPDGPRVDGTVSQRLHRNALNQMAQATDLPLKFVDALQTTGAPWGRELLAHNLNTVFHNRMSKGQYLLRSLGHRCAASSPIATADWIQGRSLKRSRRPYSRRVRCRITDM